MISMDLIILVYIAETALSNASLPLDKLDIISLITYQFVLITTEILLIITQSVVSYLFLAQLNNKATSGY